MPHPGHHLKSAKIDFNGLQGVPVGPRRVLQTDTYRPCELPQGSRERRDFLIAGSVYQTPENCLAGGSADLRLPTLHSLAPTSTALHQSESCSPIDGSTTSELSATKRGLCHVCQTDTAHDVDPLLRCSDCPRLYHRRCHPKYPDCNNLSWECYRCTKKYKTQHNQASEIVAATSGVTAADGYGMDLSVFRKEQKKPPAVWPAADIAVSSEPTESFAKNSRTLQTAPATKPSATVLHTKNKPTQDNELLTDEEDNELVAKGFKHAADEQLAQATTASNIGKPGLVQTKDLINRAESLADVSQLGRDTVRSPLRDIKRVSVGDGEKRAGEHCNVSENRQKLSQPAPEIQSKGGRLLNASVDDLTGAGKVHKRNGIPETAEAQATSDTVALSCTPNNLETKSTMPERKSEQSSKDGTRDAVNGVTQRTKIAKPGPRSSKTTPSRCAQCQRPIAHDPRGLNNMCSKCKATLSVLSAPDQVGPPHNSAAEGQHSSTPATVLEGSQVAKVASIISADSDVARNSKIFLPKQPTDVVARGVTMTAASNDVGTVVNQDGSLTTFATNPERRSPAKATKRKFCRRPAMDEYDLGDSESRPKGTYERLIGMALCAAPDHTLGGDAIVQWVADNIPNYSTKSQLWQKSLKAIMTLQSVGYKHSKGLWSVVDDDFPGNKLYKLEPGQLDKMMHWSPELGRPASRYEAAGGLEDIINAETTAKPSVAREVVQDTTGVIYAGNCGNGNRVGEIRALTETSDDEPLAHKRRKVSAQRSVATAHQADQVDATDIDTIDKSDLMSSKSMSVEEPKLSSSDIAPHATHESKKSHPRPSRIQPPVDDFSAISLFEEWPEYDPKRRPHLPDYGTATAVHRRKKRRQDGKSLPSVHDSWFNTQPIVHKQAHLLGRARPSAKFDWSLEPQQETLVECKTIEEVFDLPPHPIPVLSEGHLAYRDGLLNEDDVLPRAKIVYKTGYA